MTKETNYHLLHYPSHIGSPKIERENISPFIKKTTSKFEKFYDKRAEELRKEIEDFTRKCEINNMVISSSINFEPIVGEIYYLYEKLNGNMFLSMISPQEWKQKFVCSVELNSDGLWEEKIKK
jgi:hypothetical protein